MRLDLISGRVLSLSRTDETDLPAPVYRIRTTVSQEDVLNKSWSIRLDPATQRLPFCDEFFDTIVTTRGVLEWDNPVYVLHEVHRVLKLGGVLISEPSQAGVLAPLLSDREQQQVYCKCFAPTEDWVFRKDTSSSGVLEPRLVDLFRSIRGERGIGCGATLVTNVGFMPPPRDSVVLEVGFGQGELVRELMEHNVVYGMDAGLASIEGSIQDDFVDKACLLYMDAATETWPLPDDSVDYIFCTETLEHLGSMFFFATEASRVLKGSGLLVLSVPHQDTNDGYDAGVHSYVIPGLFLTEYFVRFFRQLYFQLVKFQKHGGSALYLFRNCKDPERPSIFQVVTGNYTEQQLYGDIIAGECSASW